MKTIAIIILGLLFCSSAYSIDETSQEKIDKWIWDYNSLNSESKIIYCLPAYDLLKSNTVYLLDHILKNEVLTNEEADKISKKYVDGYVMTYFAEHVSMFYMVEALSKKSFKGKMTRELKVDLFKKDELTRRSGKYLDNLSFLDVSEAKIPRNCMIHYLKSLQENKELKAVQIRLYKTYKSIVSDAMDEMIQRTRKLNK
jgi:hypothetical protein